MGNFNAYRPPCNSNIETFLGNLSILLNKYLGKYDNVIIMGGFNIDMKDKTNPNFDKFSEFCDTFSMTNLIKDYTCFTKTHKSSIDLILTNKEHSFQLTKTTDRCKSCSSLNINFHEIAGNSSTTKKGYVQRF